MYVEHIIDMHQDREVVSCWILHGDGASLGTAVRTEHAHLQTVISLTKIDPSFSTTVFCAYESLHIFFTFRWAGITYKDFPSFFLLFFFQNCKLVDGFELFRAVQAYSKHIAFYLLGTSIWAISKTGYNSYKVDGLAGEGKGEKKKG